MTKERIIEIFSEYVFNITDPTGTEYFVIEEDDFEKIAAEIIQETESEKQELIEALKMAVDVYEYCEKFALQHKLPMNFIRLLDSINIESILEKHTGKTIKELLK